MTVRFSRITLLASKMLGAPLVLAGLVVVAPAPAAAQGAAGGGAPTTIGAPTTAEGQAALTGLGGPAIATEGDIGPPLEAPGDDLGDRSLDEAVRALFGDAVGAGRDPAPIVIGTGKNGKFRRVRQRIALRAALGSSAVTGAGRETTGMVWESVDAPTGIDLVTTPKLLNEWRGPDSEAGDAYTAARDEYLKDEAQALAEAAAALADALPAAPRSPGPAGPGVGDDNIGQIEQGIITLDIVNTGPPPQLQPHEDPMRDPASRVLIPVSEEHGGPAPEVRRPPSDEPEGDAAGFPLHWSDWSGAVSDQPATGLKR